MDHDTTQGLPPELASWPALLTRAQVAELTCQHPRTVARATAAGELRCARPSTGGSARALYLRSDVLRWLGLELPTPAPEPRRRGRPRKAAPSC